MVTIAGHARDAAKEIMSVVRTDTQLDDQAMRTGLYAGELFVCRPTAASLRFVGLARELIAEAFGARDPEFAQFELPVEEFAALLGNLKPKFIHHPGAKEFIPALLRELGCDPARTYFDVPRLRTSTSGDYLTSGISYAFHPHRDTWYSAPLCQVNWWIPVFEIEPSNAMAFHPAYWDRPVRNGSRDYNYDEWNRTSRTEAARHIHSDTRKQPKPEEPMQLDPQTRLIPPVGGVILFSAAQMHSTVPNTSGRTRFSIDFRTVHIDDVREFRGAPNVDSECTGTTMRDYLRGTDLAHVPEELCRRYDCGPPRPT